MRAISGILFGAFFLAGVFPAAGAPAGRETVEVSDASQLSKAISGAKPGEVIVMSEGEWKDVTIDFNSTATAEAPVTLRAKTPGKVILTGASTLVFNKPYLVADGLFFTKGAIDRGSVIEFKSDHCRLTNSAIVDYNPLEKRTDYYWVYFSGNHNRMDHCFFKGKSNLQPLVGNNQDGSRHNAVEACHFKDIPHTSDNGREIFRIWGYGRSEELGDDGAYFTIENNFFERAHGEGSEIISLKSNRNVVRHNTIIGTRGGIVGRSGNFNTIEGNYLFGQNQRGSSGIRLAGQGHRVTNNYVSDVTGDGLILISGEYIDEPLTPKYEPIQREGTPLGRVPRYGHVRNGLYANNTFVNIGGVGMSIGSAYKSGFPASQRVLIPEGNRVVNNVVYNSVGAAVAIPAQDRKPPLDRFKFEPNRFEGNIVYEGGIDIDPVPTGIIEADAKLSLKDGIYRPSVKSPAIDKGVQVDVTVDIEGQPRTGGIDVGADEVSTEPVAYKPLTESDAGAEWVIEARKAGDQRF